MSFPMNVNIMVIEVQWVFSLLSQVLCVDNEKYVVEVMLGDADATSASEKAPTLTSWS